MAKLADLLGPCGIEVSEKEEKEYSAYLKNRPPLIKIKMTAGGTGAVWIGDFMLPSTTKVSFTSEVNDVTRVQVEMLALGGVEVEAEAGAVGLGLKVLDKYKPLVITNRQDAQVEVLDVSVTQSEYEEHVLCKSTEATK